MHRFNKIVHVLNDHAHEDSPSLRHSVNLAKANQADLTILKVLPEMPTFLTSTVLSGDRKKIEEKVLTQATMDLRQLAASLDPTIQVRSELRVGKKHVEIIRTVKADNYDLVTKEVDNVSWRSRHFGSDDMQLLRNCPCPVLLMKKNGKDKYGNVVAAVDFDDGVDARKYRYNEDLNQKILTLSSSLSLADFATLHVMTAYDVPQAGFISLWVDHPEEVQRELFEAEYQSRRKKMNVLMEKLEIEMGAKSFDFLSPRTHLVEGPPGREIPLLAESVDADLVVMGTVGRSGITGVVIGNTAETVLSQLQCSVLAIKPKDFVSQVN